MASPEPAAPCTWPIDRSLITIALPDQDTNPEGYAAALGTQLMCEDIAVNVLWALSGRQFGICETSMRPCADEHQPLEGIWGPMGAFRIGALIAFEGDWFAGESSHRCVISSPQAVHLPGPVYQDITGDYPITVYIDDYVLDEDEYVIEGDVLHRRHEWWPRQDFSKPLGEHGTWGVSYWRGTPPPAGVARLVGCLTNEFIAACTGGNCRLPRTVTRISRSGASYEIDPLKILANGKTGLPEVDLWLAALNPHALMQPPSVI